MPYRILHSQAEVAEYAASLDERWPERAQVIDHIATQLAQAGSRLLADKLLVVELCCGAGKLAETLLARLPYLIYTGVDVSAPALEYARNRLSPYLDRVTLVEADLNSDGWQYLTHPPVRAVVSMQSVHDLGDVTAVARIYGVAAELLASGGLFVNADLLPSTDPAAPPHPGRFPVRRHLELLRAAGFDRAACTLQLGGFAVFAAHTA
jgi:SAM-dependent methyltransferase